MTNFKNVVVFGTGHIAELVSDLIMEDKKLKLVGYCVDREFKLSDKFKGYPLIAFDEVTSKFPKEDFFLITALSYSNLNKTRENVYMKLKKLGYRFINIISSDSIFKADNIGENNIIFELNNIQKGTSIGNNCIFWSGNHIGHHSKIEDNCFISSHVVISGSVIVGKNTFIGVNSTIRDNIKIENNCVIGAGAIVLKDLKANSVVRTRHGEISKLSSDKLV